MNKFTGATIQISKHTRLYCGFTIHICPEHSKTNRRAYQIMRNGIYLGRDFSSTEAEKTIDEIIRKAKK
ncbi:DUF4761 domain-containing protein [Pantoea coffeiphila]|uniref:DUF4761 domain-containing protein n=1 Tax=Pantoea coffeiphila TaxID=1465635 RepID=UPI001960E33B|nr:DUF4761 domain-containing protein [Pantoea coffeiphila]MBM7341658.1 hypothetical protein [Pantoea coffeiphila]